VVECEALGELGRALLALAELGGGAPVGNLGVEGLVGPGGRTVAGPGVAATAQSLMSAIVQRAASRSRMASFEFW